MNGLPFVSCFFRRQCLSLSSTVSRLCVQRRTLAGTQRLSNSLTARLEEENVKSELRKSEEIKDSVKRLQEEAQSDEVLKIQNIGTVRDGLVGDGEKLSQPYEASSTEEEYRQQEVAQEEDDDDYLSEEDEDELGDNEPAEEDLPDIKPYVKETKPVEEKRTYKKVRVELCGYDYFMMEQYMKTVKAITKLCEVRTSPMFGLPKRKEVHHVLTVGARYPLSYSLDVHIRYVTLSDVVAYKMDFIVEAIQQYLPAGISCKFSLESTSDIPDHLLSPELRAEAARLAKKKKKKAKKNMHLMMR